MAGGYLGKISAVVAANTGDYVRKLNDSASTTKNFAKTISADLSRASREASKSIEGILTPLQRVERALQNAASQKLAFRGFDGAIQTVEQLRKVIERVADRPVELKFLLDETKLKSLEQIRQTIGSISEKNLTLALSVGGLEGLRRLRSDVQEVNGKLINVNVQTDAAELDRLIEVFSQISPETIKKLKVDVEARQLEQATLLTKQLVSVASEITDAYGRAKQQFSGFAAEVQVALGPGLKASDSGLLKLLEDIQNEIPIAEEDFNRLSKAAQAAVQAINRVGEADAKAKSLSGGAGLAVSRRGDVSRELDRAQASQQSGTGLSNAADLFARQKAAAEAVVVELGKMEAAELQIGGGVRVTTKEYERQLGILRNITAQIEQSTAARGNADRVAAVITGNPQNFDQGRVLQGQLESQIASLNRSQRQDFKGLLTQANDLSVGADPANLEKYLDVLQKVQFELAKKQRINIDIDKAQADAERLRSTLESLRQNAEFVITGRPQNLTQVQTELNRILATLDQASEAQRVALRPAIERVNIAVAGEQLDAANEALDELQANAAEAVTVTVNATQALSRIDAINEAWDTAIRQIPTSAAAIDAEFNGLMSRTANLGIADRLDLDPLIAAFRNSVAAGEPLISQFQRLLALREQLDSVESTRASDRPENLGLNTPLTGNRNPRTQFLDNLGGQISVLRRQIGELDEPLRAQLGPEIDRITIQFQNMARAGIRVSADEARRLSREVAAINAAMVSRSDIGQRFLQSFGGPGSAGLNLGVDQRSLQVIGGQIEFVQQRLSRLAAEARGPVISALEQLRLEAYRLFQGGALDTTEGQQQLDQYRQRVVQALSAAGGGTENRIAADIRRAGDVARGGVDRWSLGLQQAAFAVDDFMSSTGGLDQKIRAISNNVTQLGFIVGGTTGLFVALGVTLVAQAAIGITRWVNAGKSAEDMSKALNDSLQKQKSLAEELAQSFEKLGESITTKGFSAAAKEGAAFRKELEEIIKKQREAREERATEASPRGREVSGQINRLNRELRDVTDAGQAAAIRDRIASLEAERRRLSRVDLPARGLPSQREIQNSIGFRGGPLLTTAGASFIDAIGTIGSLGLNFIRPASYRNTATRVGRDAVNQFAGVNPNDPAAMLAAINARIAQINPIAERPLGWSSTFETETRNIVAARAERARLQDLRTRFEDAGGDVALRKYAETINQAGVELQSAQSQVSEAIRAGIPSALLLEGVIDTLSTQIETANKAIQAAIEEFNRNPGADGAAARRDAVIQQQQAVVDNASAARQRAAAEAAQFTEQRIVDPQVLFDARRQRAEANLQAAGLENGAIARQIRQLEAQRTAIQNRIAESPGDVLLRGIAARQGESINQQIAALEASSVALRRFTEELDRASQESQGNLQAAQQRADEVRRAGLAPGQGLAVPTVEDIDRANRNFREQRNADQRVQDEVSQARIRAEQRAQDQADPLAATFRRLREIEEAARGGTLTTDMVAERRRLNQQVDAAVSQDPRVVAARDTSTRIEERQRAEQRGRDIAMTDAERAAREAARQAADITEAFSKDGLNGRFIANRVDQQAAINRLAENQMKQVAPLIAGFREERMNAILQGPSRAALNVADAQTTEGARELNRLLRGDDPNKDVNLVELQKQTETLERVIKAIEENGQGAVVDIRG